MFKVETLTTDEAIASIVAKMKVLRADEDDSNEGKYEMFAEKLVFEVLTYCNREDFPKPLIYTCLDLELYCTLDLEILPNDVLLISHSMQEFKI